MYIDRASCTAVNCNMKKRLSHVFDQFGIALDTELRLYWLLKEMCGIFFTKKMWNQWLKITKLLFGWFILFQLDRRVVATLIQRSVGVDDKRQNNRESAAVCRKCKNVRVAIAKWKCCHSANSGMYLLCRKLSNGMLV